jgi:hypothetical protein
MIVQSPVSSLRTVASSLILDFDSVDPQMPNFICNNWAYKSLV